MMRVPSRPSPASNGAGGSENGGDEFVAAIAEFVALRVIDRLTPLLNDLTVSSTPWLTVADAADRLRAPKSRVYELLRTGRLASYRDGRRVLLRVEDVDGLPDAAP
jgi:excisionase family DNA binding protein